MKKKKKTKEVIKSVTLLKTFEFHETFIARVEKRANELPNVFSISFRDMYGDTAVIFYKEKLVVEDD